MHIKHAHTYAATNSFFMLLVLYAEPSAVFSFVLCFHSYMCTCWQLNISHCICILMYVCMYVYIYTYIYICIYTVTVTVNFFKLQAESPHSSAGALTAAALLAGHIPNEDGRNHQELKA